MAAMAAMVAATGMITVPLPINITPPPPSSSSSSSSASSSLFGATLGAPGAATVQPNQFRHGRRHICRAQLGEQESQMAKRLGNAVIPLLAAALVGGMPTLDSLMVPSMAIAAEVDTAPAPDSYRDLLLKFKERRANGGVTAPSPAPTPAPAPVPESASPAAARLKEAAERARKEREANEARVAQKQEEQRRQKEDTARAIAEKEKAAVEKARVAAAQQKVGVSSITVKQRTHGFLPLFVAQFFLLLATLGAGAVLFVLPESQLKQAQDKFDEFVDKAAPVLEDSYTQAKPVVSKVLATAQEAGVRATPYAQKAWEQAKPVAAKTFAASKVLLREAGLKANELLEKAQEEKK